MNWPDFWVEAAITSYTLAVAGFGVDFILKILKREERFKWVWIFFVGLGFLLTTLLLGHRMILSHHAPGSNFYESLLLWSWCVILMYGIFVIRVGKFRLDGLTLLTTLAALIPMAYATWLDSSIEPLFPALQSFWLNIHVPLCFLGYGALTIGFISGALFLLQGERAMGVSGFRQLEQLTHQTIAAGFLLYTAGMITGALWANEAWGSWWRWDPKQNASLLAWIVYAIYLQLRVGLKWSLARCLWISMVGYGCVVFNFIAVNFSGPTLHNYLRQP